MREAQRAVRRRIADDAVNADAALTASMVPSPIALQSPCRLEALFCHAHFVERLTAVAHFFVPRAYPRFSQYFARPASAIRLSALVPGREKQRSRSRQIFGRILRQDFAVE
jgi:hypothetical protein